MGVMFAVIQEARAQGWTAVEARLAQYYHGINKDQLRQVLHTWARHHLGELTAGVWQT